MGLYVTIFIFTFCALVIAIAGTYLTKTADRFADISGLGEAMVGAILLGAVTSLSGIVTSVTAAYEGYARLSVSNAIGGIVAQTAFLAIADIAYTKANLEHASASFSNLMQVVLLILMLSFLLIIINLPPVSFYGIHPASVALICIYLLGFRKISRAGEHPMWAPKRTYETVEDKPDTQNLQNISKHKLLLKFTGLATIVVFAGYWVARSGMTIATATGISETFVGTTLTAIVTSLPELIVAVSAVRQKALTMAVSNVVGGNAFDLLFVSFADFAYLKGSVLHYISNSEIFIISVTLLLSAILLFGLLEREKEGFARIGWESSLILFICIATYVILFFI